MEPIRLTNINLLINKWEKLLNNIPFPLFVKNQERQFIYFNKKFIDEIRGYDFTLAIGKAIDEINIGLNIEQRRNIKANDEKILMFGGEVNDDVELMTKDNTIHFFQETKYVYTSSATNEKYIIGILVDVTEKIKLQKELSNEQSFLAALLTNSSDHIYFKDKDSKFIKVSDSFANRHGKKIKDVIGKTDFDYFGKNHAKEAFLDEQEIIRSGRSIVGKEEKEDWPNGETTWVSTSKMPFYNSKGEIIGTFGISREITALKRSEEEKINLVEFEKITSKIATVFLKHSSDNFIIALSLALKELKEFLKFKRSSIYFFNEKENKLKKMHELPEPKTEDDNELNITQYTNWHRVLSNLEVVFDTETDILNYGRSKELDYLIKHQFNHIIIVPFVSYQTLCGFALFECENNTNSWLQVNKSLFKILGEILNNTFSNYQAEKYRLEAEEEMLKFLWAANQSTNIIVILDKKGRYEYVNGKYSEISGYSFSEMTGNMAEFLNPESKLNSDSSLIWNKIEQGLHWEGKIQNITKSGKSYWEWISITPIKNLKNETTNFLVIAEDITEKMVEDSRKAVSQKLESIGQLAAGIAHEINTPMQYIGDNTVFLKETIKTLTEFILSLESEIKNYDNNIENGLFKILATLKLKYDVDYLLDEVSRSIDQTRTGISRVTNIVKAMKDFAHPGMKEKVHTDINHGIEVTATISKNEWKYVANMELELSNDLPSVYCLQDELNQVILIMIINAAHAIEEKNGKNSTQKGNIKIQTYKEDENAVIEISDSGAGIKEENLSKIFDPFYTTKEVGKGTGQGLTIAHDIVINKHGGSLDVDSEYGLGTTFTIKIPIRHQDE